LVKGAYYPLFDYVRGLAAVGVFISHADKYHYLPEEVGNACVQIFFALSGFLIGGILLHSKRMDIPRFYFNRSTRIWIPYVLAIFLLFLVTLLKQGFSDPKFGEFFIYMATFVYNCFGPPQLAQSVHHMPLDGTGNHFWSICVEEQFYLIAPFIIILMNRAAAIALLTGAVMFNFFVPHEFAAISLGVLLALANRSSWIIAGSAIAAILSLIFFQYEIWMPFIAVTIIAIAAQPGESHGIVAKAIGGASFPFYLNHWVGLFAISAGLKIGLSYPISAAIGFGVAATIAVSHYLIIDRSIAIHRSRFFTTKRGYLLCATGFALVLIGATFGLVMTKA